MKSLVNLNGIPKYEFPKPLVFEKIKKKTTFAPFTLDEVCVAGM